MTQWICSLLLAALLAAAQGPPMGRGGRGGFGRGGLNWWENPLINNPELNLSETQRRQMQATTREYRNRLVDARATVDKAEGDLQDAFNDGTADERRVNELIDRVVKARGEMLKLVTQMSWKLRANLTPEQWRQLRRPMGPPGDGPRRGQRGPMGPPLQQGKQPEPRQ